MVDHSKLVVQLRGELGETIHTWVLLRYFSGVCSRERTGDVDKDLKNQNLWFLTSLIERLENDLIARLAELSDGKSRAQLTFAHAIKSLRRMGLSTDGVDRIAGLFSGFVSAHGFIAKRNQEISHRAYVVNWTEERAPIHIAYRSLLSGLALAIRTMKHIDEQMYGPIHCSFMWQSLRGSRYSSALPPRVAFMIAHHIRLPAAIRGKIIMDEIRAGQFHQELMDTMINGVPVKLFVSKKWGAINLGGRLQVLEQYPLQSIANIDGDGIVVDPAWTRHSDTTFPEIDSRVPDELGPG